MGYWGGKRGREGGSAPAGTQTKPRPFPRPHAQTTPTKRNNALRRPRPQTINALCTNHAHKKSTKATPPC